MKRLIKDLNIQKYKLFEGVLIDSIGEKLLQISYMSSSILSAEKKLQDLIEYIEKRHTDIRTGMINSINDKIIEINYELIFREELLEKLYETYQALNFKTPNQVQEYSQVQNEILQMQTAGVTVFQLKKEKRFLETELVNITNQSVKVQMVQKIQSSEVNSNLLVVLIAAFIGFILSFIIVFIIKAFRPKIEN
jgi:hypothetical protein